MVTQTRDFSSYVLPRERFPVTDNVLVGPDEIGEAVLAYRNEAFRGRVNIEDNHSYAPNAQLSFSNVPRVLFDNATLRRLTEGNPRGLIRLLGPADVIIGWDGIPERSETYADTDAIIVGSKSGSNEEHRQAVLSIIGGRYQAADKHPLVRGLTVVPADNKDGFEFKGTDYMTVEEVPDWMRKTQKVCYDPEKKMIVPDENGVQVYGAIDSGLRGVSRDEDGLGASWDDDLVNAGEYGRVQVVRAA